MDRRQGALEKARAYAFLLLKFRLRSREELRQRMRQKKFREDIIKETLDFLEEKSFIDDRAFARAWISTRIKKPLGPGRLKQELRLKGVDKNIIDSELNKAKSDNPEGEVVLELARARLNKIKKGEEPYKVKQKVFQYLARRGFSSEAITDALTQL